MVTSLRYSVIAWELIVGIYYSSDRHIVQASITDCPLGHVRVILEYNFYIRFMDLTSWAILINFLLRECHRAHRWYLNIGLGDSVLLPGNRPSHKPIIVV